LENLTKLDVLDLHGNQIRDIENLGHLSELRVLNLAGNQIEVFTCLLRSTNTCIVTLKWNDVMLQKSLFSYRACFICWWYIFYFRCLVSSHERL